MKPEVNSDSQTPGSDHMKEDCHRKPASIPVFQETVVAGQCRCVWVKRTGMPACSNQRQVPAFWEGGCLLHSHPISLLFWLQCQQHLHSLASENTQWPGVHHKSSRKANLQKYSPEWLIPLHVLSYVERKHNMLLCISHNPAQQPVRLGTAVFYKCNAKWEPRCFSPVMWHFAAKQTCW